MSGGFFNEKDYYNTSVASIYNSETNGEWNGKR